MTVARVLFEVTGLIRFYLTYVVESDNIEGCVARATRPISWIKAAQKDFGKFPEEAQEICLDALTIAAEGGKADIAKPMTGLGSGILEIALPYKSDAFRVMYALQIGESMWVLHAFQKKSTSGRETPKPDINLIRERIKKLKEALK